MATTTIPRPNRRRTRTTARVAHLVVGGVLGTYVYAPDAITDAMRLPVQIAGIPLLTATGLFMWKPAWFRARTPASARRGSATTRRQRGGR